MEYCFFQFRMSRVFRTLFMIRCVCGNQLDDGFSTVGNVGSALAVANHDGNVLQTMSPLLMLMSPSPQTTFQMQRSVPDSVSMARLGRGSVPSTQMLLLHPRPPSVLPPTMTTAFVLQAIASMQIRELRGMSS